MAVVLELVVLVEVMTVVDVAAAVAVVEPSWPVRMLVR